MMMIDEFFSHTLSCCLLLLLLQSLAALEDWL